MPEGTECAVQAAARLGGVELVWGGVGLGVRFWPEVRSGGQRKRGPVTQSQAMRMVSWYHDRAHLVDPRRSGALRVVRVGAARVSQVSISVT